MKLKILPLLFLLITTLPASAQKATFSGIVLDENSVPLPHANIFIMENNRGTTSNLDGEFRLTLDPGEFTIVIRYMGYKTIKEKIVFSPNQKYYRKFIMVSTAIQLGEITVVAEDEFIPLAPETKSIIQSGEIKHIQATSLNDVLQLIPGEKTTNPTLHSSAEASIRGGNSLGTQVIMDGVPISNNANMQIGIGSTSGNSGIDLRAIPAENIQEVEVIRGIPSAQHGDLIDGIMIVKTKSQPEPLRTKFKYNPHLYETNISGGMLVKNWAVNGNFNLALAQRDIRVEGDGYTRIAAQVSANRETNRYNLKNLLYYTRTFDESKEKPGYALREAWYNRDFNLKYSTNGFFKFSQLAKISGKFSISYTRQNSYLQQLISRDNLVLSDRLEEGAQEGFIVFGSYLGKKWIKGDVWNIFSDLFYQQQFSTNSFFHTFTGGLTWRNDFNKGEGTVFNPLFPPILGTQAIRLRTYDDLPAYNTLSFYAEDRITGRLIKPFTLQAGFRYEAFRPNGINFEGLWNNEDFIESFNGSFLNPRFNFSYNISKNTQLRLGFGSTSKSPPLGMIFPGIQYFDVVDTVAVVDPTYADSNFSLISTYKRDRSNKYLKGYHQKKYEISIDQQIGSLGFTVTGFINDTKNMFKSLSIPIILSRKSFPDYPDISTAFEKGIMFDDFNQYINDGWLKSKGIEFSLKTKRLPVIETVFSFDAAYQYRESGQNLEMKGSKRDSPELGLTVIPFYNPYTKYEKNLLLNYRFDIQARSLGIWVTLHIQQNFLEIDGRNGLTDTLAIGYFSEEGVTVFIDESDLADEKYIRLRRYYEPYELLEENPPNLWLFNLKVTKSLWTGAEVSFYVNNFFNHRPFYQRKRSHPNYPTFTRRNPGIFFGVEVSSSLGVF